MKRLNYFLLPSLLLIAACGSSGYGTDGSAPADAGDLVGVWDYEVVGPDVLDLRTGVVEFVLDQGALSGGFDAVHLDFAPLRNIRYRGGELTFTAQAFPGGQSGLAFAVDVNGDSMSGVAFLTANSQSVATGGIPTPGGNTADIRLRRR